MIYYTADQHFGHSNIIGLCNRPYNDIAEMDENLIINWNSTVTADDVVYILGDLVFRSGKHASYYIERLNGVKHLVLGNHDHKWVKNCNLQKYFASVSYYLEITDNERRLALSHYPMLSWGGAARGALHVHAHIHNKREGLVFETLKKMDNALNAGVEINEYKPVKLDELISNNIRFKGSKSEMQEFLDEPIDKLENICKNTVKGEHG
ncbi:MAG: hydrolase [Clostridia bacterium]|nr:hydrolase [Clostridia bacterium]